MIMFIQLTGHHSLFTMRYAMNSKMIKAGMLVTRNRALFLVLEIGECYHDGFALCRYIGNHSTGDHWIIKTLLQPV
jgi:hypothetical protein